MKALKIIGKILLTVLVTVVFVLIALIAVIFLLEKGPSENAKVVFVNSVCETSRMGFVAEIFLSKEEVEEILNKGSMNDIDKTDRIDDSLIQIDTDKPVDPIEIVYVTGGSFKGVMMKIHDPSKVFVGTVPEFGHFDGMVVKDIIASYENRGTPIVGGINGGDFIDLGTNNSFTAQPLGAVISEGEVVYYENGRDYEYHLVGLTNDNKLVIGYYTIDQAIEAGIRDAIYCVHETGPFLVKDGEALINEVPDSSTYGGGKNPRTAIGQTADGTILMLVVDGRQANSLGATFKDLAYVMLEHGAVNAAAMDGGTSSQLIYEYEMLSHPYSAYGARKCPTSWLVKE